jgi:hypothetical protein
MLFALRYHISVDVSGQFYLDSRGNLLTLRSLDFRHLAWQELIPTVGNLGLFYLTPEVHARLHADGPLMARVVQWKARALASPTGFIDDDLTRGLRFNWFVVSIGFITFLPIFFFLFF